MSAFAPLLRQRLASSTRTRSVRFASTIPRPHVPQQMGLGERLQRFCPIEAYPLVFFVAAMSTFGITYGVKAFNAVPGELRLMPSRYYPHEQKKEVWEQD